MTESTKMRRMVDSTSWTGLMTHRTVEKGCGTKRLITAETAAYNHSDIFLFNSILNLILYLPRCAVVVVERWGDDVVLRKHLAEQLPFGGVAVGAIAVYIHYFHRC